MIADEALREGQFVAGANRDGWHLRGVEAGRDFEPRFADIRQAREGDACPECGGRLVVQTAIEVGHIFKLGTFYSEPLGATFLDEDGQREADGHGQLRDRAGPDDGGDRRAAPRRARHLWPRSRRAVRRRTSSRCPASRSRRRRSLRTLDAAGQDVLLDDRDQRAGEKFADADLIGIPTRITVGKKTLEDGAVDVRDRASGEERRVPVAEVGN